MKNPLLSIVIANYNYGRFLEDAIKSVIAQKMGNQVELIVCDAASADNSVTIIEKYACGLPSNVLRDEWRANTSASEIDSQLISWWCSEKDGGQSAAFNKGFAHAKGRFLTWLNADDLLLPGALVKFKAAVEESPDCEWFVGGGMWLDANLRIMQMRRGCSFSRIRANRAAISAWGPSSFFSRRLLNAVGGVDERFHYMMDTDLWLSFYHKEKAVYRPFGDYTWGFRFHDAAKTSGHNFSSNATNDPNHPMWQQVAFERRLLREKNGIVAHMSTIARFASIDYYKTMRSEFDMLRYKGKNYEEYFATH